MNSLLSEVERRIAEEDRAAAKFDSPEPSMSSIVKDLAKLPPLEYDRKREKAAEDLGVRVSTLDTEVKRKRVTEETDEGGRAVILEDPEPWPEKVIGAELLTDLAEQFSRYIVLPDGAADALALWTIHTHTHDAARISPILALSSPEKRCGKTTALSLLGVLVRKPLPASNITAAALFRATEKWRPTLLIDEADTFLRDSDELRGVINSGHTKDAAYVIRTVGEDFEPKAFSTWAPKAIALIGNMPPTLTDRAIVIKMRRKRPDEQAERLRLDRLTGFEDLRRQSLRWTIDYLEALKATDPETPAGLNDRAADNWRPLFAIAHVAGGDWLRRAESAVMALTEGEDSEEAAGVMLLQDIRRLFDRHKSMSSEDLANKLADMEDRPWPEWRQGKPITPRQAAKLLKPFGIKPKNVRIGERVPKGYEAEQFDDAFARYLPNLSATPLQINKINNLGNFLSATRRTDVADKKAPNPLNNKECSGVADRKGDTPVKGVSVGASVKNKAGLEGKVTNIRPETGRIKVRWKNGDCGWLKENEVAL